LPLCPNRGISVAMKRVKRRKPASERKEGILRVRLTDSQRTLLDEAAQREGLAVSSWARQVLLREARKSLVSKMSP
jgi:uncharacterized protein (DUF1778 family)